MKVLKFGGTSIGGVSEIQKVIQIIQSNQKEQLVLVFSAFGKTTDQLIEMANHATAGHLKKSEKVLKKIKQEHLELARAFHHHKLSYEVTKNKIGFFFSKLEELIQGLALLQDFSPVVQDQLLSFGELLSNLILHSILQQQFPAVFVDSREIVVTDSQFTRAEPDMEKTRINVEKMVRPLIRQGKMPIVPGFIAANRNGRTTTLGRGGSDYTAALLGAILIADEVQIWTDVDGIMTADPSIVPEAQPIQSMSFQEAAELAYFGARVLHPKTIAPAMERKIPVRVLNTNRPEASGTRILPDYHLNGDPVKSIAYKEEMTLITIVSTRMFKAYGFLKRIFEAFDSFKLPVDLVATTEVSVAIAVHEIADLKALIHELEAFGKVEYQENQAVVCVVGERMRQEPGIAGRIFSSIAEVPISMISQGGSEIDISFVCAEHDLSYIINNLHRTFFRDAYEERINFLAEEQQRVRT